MKTLWMTASLCAVMLATQAQDIDRSKPPKPGPAPVINIADPETFTLSNGLRVFVVRNTKLPRVNATLLIDLDPLAEGDKVGAADMAGSLMRRGTTTMNKQQLDEAIDYLGGSVSTSATTVNAGSLKKHFPALMALMADVVLRPAMQPDEMEKLRTQTISGLAQQKDDPATIASNVGNALVYGKNHPYGEMTTEESVMAITINDLKQYHNTYWKPNVGYLVFVGDITGVEAKALAEKHFGPWQKGTVPKHQYAPVNAPAKTYIALVNRPSATQSNIRIASPVSLKPGAADAIPASVMSTILGGGFSSRLNQNLREKYGFTYGAGGGISSDKLVGRFVAGASVRNEKTDSAVGQFLYEFNRIQQLPASDSEVNSLKNYMSGSFARSLEDPSTIADFALSTARYNLPKDYYRNYLTNLAAVNASSVKAMASKYVPGPSVITIVGNAREIAAGLEKYGEVRYVDMYGNPVEAPGTTAVDAGVTAESVMQKALDAYGGNAAIANIKDVTMKGEMSIMGQSLQYEQKHVLPDGYSNTVSMNGMALMKQQKLGSKYAVSTQGSDQEITEAVKMDMDARAALFPELYYLKHTDIKKSVKGIEKVEGKDCYDVEVVMPDDTKLHYYYDTSTGLLVQDVREQELGPMGKVTATTIIKAYKTVNGVKFPEKLSVDLGQFKQEVTITDITVNKGLLMIEL